MHDHESCHEKISKWFGNRISKTCFELSMKSEATNRDLAIGSLDKTVLLVSNALAIGLHDDKSCLMMGVSMMMALRPLVAELEEHDDPALPIFATISALLENAVLCLKEIELLEVVDG